MNYNILYESPSGLTECKICWYQEKTKEYTQEFYGLMGKMFEKNQKNRISAKKALEHPWFANYES